MRNAHAAEWILRLVTTAERAACTTGDLLEEAAGRSAFWFWSSTLRTAARMVWGELCAHRGRMAWLSFSGLMEYSIAGAAVAKFVIPIWVAVAPYPCGPNTIYIPPWGFYYVLGSLRFATLLVVGWDVARRSKGRELASALALALGLAAIAAMNTLASGTPVRHVETPYPYTSNVFVSFGATALCTMAGAILFRLRDQARCSPVAGPVPPNWRS